MDAPLSVPDILSCLSMAEIQKSLPEHSFSSREKRSREKLHSAVYRLSENHHAVLSDVAHRKKRRLATRDDVTTNSVEPIVPEVDDENFFETVSEDIRRNCISSFIDATGHDATSSACCAVCAGQFFSKEITQVKVDDLRAKNVLSPTVPHRAHILTDGMLLHRTSSSMHTSCTGVHYANVCISCLKHLQNNKLPPLSLANGMWVGDVPLELRVLTLPERILVARYFPAAYIVKLYPMKKGAHSWSSSSLQSGLRGNVSTYRLNTKDIIDMTQTQVMPPSPEILAATIGVMFVGPKNLPEKTLPGFLRVNRTRVHDALRWLKENNPIYQNIEISSDRLNSLPDDGVPVEIWSLMKHSDDTTLLAEEHDNYVPDDVPEDSGQSNVSHIPHQLHAHVHERF